MPDSPSSKQPARPLPGSARGQDMLDTDFLSLPFPLKPLLISPLFQYPPMGSSFPSSLPLSSLLPGTGSPSSHLSPKPGHCKGFGDHRSDKVATDELVSRGGLCFSHKNDWKWDQGGQVREREPVSPSRASRVVVDAGLQGRAACVKPQLAPSLSCLTSSSFLLSLKQVALSRSF